MQQAKPEAEAVETSVAEDMARRGSNGEALVMRAKSDDLTIWQSVLRYKRVGYIAMLAAFCASLDGYRETGP